MFLDQYELCVYVNKINIIIHIYSTISFSHHFDRQDRNENLI